MPLQPHSPKPEAPAARQATREPSPFFAEACAIVAAQQERRAQTFTGGVSWSAMTSPAPEVEDVETVRRRLVREDEAAKAFAASPLGRFYRAVREIQDLGCYLEEGDKLEGWYRRSLSASRRGEPLNVGAVGACLAILEGMPAAVARDARAALIEMLISTERKAA